MSRYAIDAVTLLHLVENGPGVVGRDLGVPGTG